MRRWGRIAIGCGIVAIAPAYACLLDIPDVVTSDASVDSGPITFDVNVPETCVTLDASCIAVPSGWQPVILANDGGACASDFTPTMFVTNGQLAAGACECPKCTTTGAYSCDASVEVLSNTASCTSSAKIQPGQCAYFPANGYLEYFAYGPVGATCDAGEPTPGAVTTDSLTACFPASCTTDFCDAPGTKCITQTGSVACPAAFPQFTLVGSGATANCTSCGCALKPVTCKGTLQYYSTIDCSGGGVSLNIPNVCTNIGTTAGSVEFTPTFIAPPSCTEQQDASTVTVDSPRTICCAP